MKLSTTPSVVVRIIIWLFLLIGGAFIGFKNDITHFTYLLKNIPFHIITFIIGIFILRLAFRASARGGRELAKYGRIGNIPRLETNNLVTSGIYRCTRHPMLFGLMFLPLGFALILGSPTFIIFIAPVEAIFILIMILTLEEQEAIRKFGDAYLKYKEQTPLIPKSYKCWKALFRKDIKEF